jgi:hypothetical protein
LRELSLNILDLTQNSIAAGANRIEITVESRNADNTLRICIADNGKGMNPEALAKVKDPFFTTRTTRKVGMGIPLFAQAAIECEGWLRMDSEPDQGTVLEAEFRLDHVDRVPLGDITATLVTLIAANPEMDFIYKHVKNEKQFILDTRELRENLQGVGLAEPEVLKWLRDYIGENVEGKLRID